MIDVCKTSRKYLWQFSRYSEKCLQSGLVYFRAPVISQFVDEVVTLCSMVDDIVYCDTDIVFASDSFATLALFIYLFTYIA